MVIHVIFRLQVKKEINLHSVGTHTYKGKKVIENLFATTMQEHSVCDIIVLEYLNNSDKELIVYHMIIMIIEYVVSRAFSYACTTYVHG